MGIPSELSLVNIAIPEHHPYTIVTANITCQWWALSGQVVPLKGNVFQPINNILVLGESWLL